MSSLQKPLSPILELQTREIVPFALVAKAMSESLTEPIRQIQESLRNMLLPINIMEESFNTSLAPMIKILDNYAETNRTLIANSLAFSFPSDYFKTFSYIEADITEENAQPSGNSIFALPDITPNIQTKVVSQTSSIKGLKQIAGGSFKYNRKTLKKLSSRNNEGRLLSLFISAKDGFVSDEETYKKLYIKEYQSFSWVLRNLKNKLRDNGLISIIERRWDPNGYIFVDLNYLH